MPLNALKDYWTQRSDTLSAAIGTATATLAAALQDQSTVQAQTALNAGRRKQLTQEIADLRARLSSVPMPADSEALLLQWTGKRTEFQQEEAKASDLERQSAGITSQIAATRLELDLLQVEAVKAQAEKNAAGQQWQDAVKVMERLASPAFTDSSVQAADLLANAAPDARSKLDQWVPETIRAILDTRHTKLAQTAELAKSTAQAGAPDKAALDRAISEARVLVDNAVSQGQTAKAAFSVWQAIDGAAKPGPVTPQQRDRLAALAADHSQGLVAFLAAETALLAREEAEAKLQIHMLHPPAANADAAAHTVFEQTRDGLIETLNQKKQAYAQAAGSADITPETLATLAEVPDSWVAAVAKHQGLVENLKMQSEPLGVADAAAVEALFTGLVDAIRQTLETEAARTDASRAAACEAARQAKLAAAMLARLKNRNVRTIGGRYAA